MVPVSVTVAPSCGRWRTMIAEASGDIIARLRPTALGVPPAPERTRWTLGSGARRLGGRGLGRLDGRRGGRTVRDQLVLAPGGPDLDRRERHPDLAERLDRHEEAGEQEHDAEELAGLEELREPNRFRASVPLGEKPRSR